MASIKARAPSGLTNTGLGIFIVGSALVVAAMAWRGWFVDGNTTFGLRGSDVREHDGTLGEAGSFTFVVTMLAVATSLIGALLPETHGARTLVRGVAALAGFAALMGAAYFISELPREARLSWGFPIFLQGMTLSVVGLALPRSAVTPS